MSKYESLDISKKYKKNNMSYNGYNKYLKNLCKEISKMVYKIEAKKEKIQIFGENFVKNNKKKLYYFL